MTSERARAHFALMWGERARVTSASVTPKTTTISWEYANSAGRWRYEIIYCARTSHCLLLRFFFLRTLQVYLLCCSSHVVYYRVNKNLFCCISFHEMPRDDSRRQSINLYIIIDVIDITALCSIPSWLYSLVLPSLCFAFI